METRFLSRAVQQARQFPSKSLRHASSARKPSTQQANPIGDYYASILSSPTPVTIFSPSTQKNPIPPVPASVPPPPPNAGDILFSSRLSSPLERRSEIAKNSNLVAGVWVPLRPVEPDNCCMSGCVNCVYDRYRDELEEWSAANQAAKSALKKEAAFAKGKKKRSRGNEGDVEIKGMAEGEEHTLLNMDDDGGGSEEDLFEGIPVGIREFMRTEKMLKEKQARNRSNVG